MRDSSPTLLDLGIENQETKKTVAGVHSEPSKEEDTFYDAVEFLPKQHDVAVQDVFDEENDEIRDLRSIQRNRAPGQGQWMEPVGYSYSTFASKPDP